MLCALRANIDSSLVTELVGPHRRAPKSAPRVPASAPRRLFARPTAPRSAEPHGRLWRPSAAVTDDRAMSQRRLRLAPGQMPSVQDGSQHPAQF
jgi:hypothetical protein